MNKTTSIGLLIIAALLLVLGIEAYQSSIPAGSHFTNATPSDTAVWLVISGLLAGITGIFNLTSTKEDQLPDLRD